jgi:hypothetical protein
MSLAAWSALSSLAWISLAIWSPALSIAAPAFCAGPISSFFLQAPSAATSATSNTALQIVPCRISHLRV